MKIDCVVFDFDGTLFDSMFIWDIAGGMYLRSVGREPKPFLLDTIKALSLYQTACYFRDEYALPLSVDKIMAGINRTVEHFYINEIQPKPGVTGFLEELKKAGIPVCIATASDRYQIEAALKRCSMEQYFDAIFTCSEVGHGKDEPFIFRKAMEHFGASRSGTVIFEDAIHAAETAKADGFTVAAVFDGSEKRQDELRALADLYLPDFEHTEEFWKFASA